MGVDLPSPGEGMEWVDVLGGAEVTIDSDHCFVFDMTGPAVLVRSPIQGRQQESAAPLEQ